MQLRGFLACGKHPALVAPAIAVLDSKYLLLPLEIRSNGHQDAESFVIEPYVAPHPVGPHVCVRLRKKRLPPPLLVFVCSHTLFSRVIVEADYPFADSLRIAESAEGKSFVEMPFTYSTARAPSGVGLRRRKRGKIGLENG